MVQRDLTAFRSVTQEPNISNNMMPEIVMDATAQVVQASLEAKILENYSKLQLDLNQFNNEYKIKNELNPDEAFKKYNFEFNKVVNKYSDEISPLFKGRWVESTNKLKNNNSLQMQDWAFRQGQVNAENSIKSAFENNIAIAQISGQNYASGKGDINSLLDFEATIEPLKQIGYEKLGETATNKLIQDYKKDYMKSFIVSTMQTNPQRAIELIQNENIREGLTPIELQELDNLSKKVTKQIDYKKNVQSTGVNSDLIDYIYSPETDYLQKRLMIDKMEFEGQLKPSVATKARRVLTSLKNVEPKTEDADFSDIITRVYDLNTIQEQSPQEYLQGIQNIQEEILDKQSEGRLTNNDVIKINKQIKTLTGAKIAGATQQVAMNFQSANDKFQTLPPQYRGKAVRLLFDLTEGQDLTPEGYDIYTRDVINQVNLERRNNSQKIIAKIKNPIDETQLKEWGYTMQDVRETAKKRGITEAEVYWQLQGKRNIK